MERMNFVRIMTAALVLGVMTSAPGALAETCFVDLEEETADLDQQFALHVGRDDGGMVVCLGPMEGAVRDIEPPRVVARVDPEGPCVTEAGESYSRSDEGFSEVVVSVAGHTPALLRADAGLVCDHLDGMSPYVEAGQTMLFEYTDVLSVDEGMPVEVFNFENGSHMALELEEDSSDGGGGIRSNWWCYMEDDDHYESYGQYIYNNVAYSHYIIVCEFAKDEYECIGSAPEDEGDYVTIVVDEDGDGSFIFSPSSTMECNDNMSVGRWPYWSWDGHIYLNGDEDVDVLYGAGGDDTIRGRERRLRISLRTLCDRMG